MIEQQIKTFLGSYPIGYDIAGFTICKGSVIMADDVMLEIYITEYPYPKGSFKVDFECPSLKNVFKSGGKV